jgi:hypothetical protein
MRHNDRSYPEALTSSGTRHRSRYGYLSRTQVRVQVNVQTNRRPQLSPPKPTRRSRLIKRESAAKPANTRAQSPTPMSRAAIVDCPRPHAISDNSQSVLSQTCRAVAGDTSVVFDMGSIGWASPQTCNTRNKYSILIHGWRY